MGTTDEQTEGARPHSRAITYQPGLDGVRALGIISVLLYHGGVGWAQGGFLGVEAFFVLSGFLITSLLVAEWQRDTTINLGGFWARRARRLLPALFCLVAVVGIYQAVAGSSRAVPDLLPDGLATLFYIGNWHQIWTGSNYFADTGRQSPLLHTWSLAIEEQFYLIWPLVVLGVMRIGMAARSSRLKILLVVAVAGAVASAVEMAVLYSGPSSVDRVYYGTDTRAQGLLAGAALAIGLAQWRNVRTRRQHSAVDIGRGGGVVLGIAGVFAGAGVLWSMYAAGKAGGTSPVIYQGGMLAFDGAVVVLIASVLLAPNAPVAWLLSTWPMRQIGKISYGLYLWHWPLFLWLTQQSTGFSGFSLLALRIGASFVVAIASYFLVEQPIRERRWSITTIRALAPVGVAGAVAALLVAAGVAPVAAAQKTNTQPGATTTTIPVHAGPVSWVGKASCKARLAAPPPYDVPVEYHTCPPVRVELLGDSMAQTLGFGLEEEQEPFGVLMADNAQLGCSFGLKGLIDATGTGFGGQNRPCLTQFQTWQRDVKSFKAQAIVVMMGYWDCYDRLWNGQDVHIGEPAFDAYLYSQMVKFVHQEGIGGIPIVVLTVPWVDPPAEADGSPQPAASASRHDEINAMLARLAAAFPAQVHLINTDKYISPGNHFDADLNGKQCRWSDGVHFYPYCGAVLAAPVMTLVRRLVAADGGPGPSGVRRAAHG